MKMVRLEVNWYDEDGENCELISIFVWPEDIKMIREADREERKENNVESIITIKTYHPIVQKTFISNIEAPKSYIGCMSSETTVTHPEEEDSDFYWDSPMTINCIEQRINLAMN